MAWAQEVGKKTGIVTTTRLTHATPSALYAHVPHRDWECDAAMVKANNVGEGLAEGEPDPDQDVIADIARQMVEGSVGRNANVILGGGLRGFKQ